MFCSNCGNQLEPSTKFCPNCGAEQPNLNGSINNQSNVNSDNVTYQNVGNDKQKKSSNIVLIIILVVVFIVAILIVFKLLTKQPNIQIENNQTNNQENNNIEKKANTNDDEYGKASVEDCGDYCYTYRNATFDINDLKVKAENDKDETKNIQIYQAFKDTEGVINRNSIIIYGKNNNAYPVTIKLYFNVYDDGNYKLDNSSEYINVVNANSEFAVNLSTSVNNAEFTKYNITYTANKPESYYKVLNVDKKDLTTSKGTLYGGSTIDFSIKNNTQSTLSCTYVVIKYYKNNKLVFVNAADVGNILEPIESGKTGKDYVYNPQIDFDNYEYEIIGSYFYDKSGW